MARGLTAQEDNLRDVLKLKMDQMFAPGHHGRELFVTLGEIPTPYGPTVHATVTARVYPSLGVESRRRLHMRLVEHLHAVNIHHHDVVIL